MGTVLEERNLITPARERVESALPSSHIRDQGLRPEAWRDGGANAAVAELLAGAGAGREIGPEPKLNVPAEISRELADRIRAHGGFGELSVEAQQKYMDALAAARRAASSPHQRVDIEEEFLRILDRKVKGELSLEQRDRSGEGATLIDHIHSLATHDERLMERALQGRRAEMVLSLLREINNADGELNQGSRGAYCVQAVAFTQMARSLPAEYARFVQEMATTGRVRLVSEDPQTGQRELGRMMLEFDSKSVAVDRMFGRSVTESMLMTATANLVGAGMSGIYDDEAELVYEAILGVPFVRIDDKDQAMAELRRAASAGAGQNMVSLRWDAEGEHVNHALEVIKVEGDRVYFRNPWGKEFKNPPSVGSHVVDGDSSIYWMGAEDFAGRINYALVTEADPNAKFGITPGAEGGRVLTYFEVDPEYVARFMEHQREEEERRRRDERIRSEKK